MSVESEVKTLVQDTFCRPKTKISRNWASAGVVAIVALGIWAISNHAGHRSFSYVSQECVRFAKEREVFPSGHEIRAVDLRTRNGKSVVDLIANAPGSKELQSRVCVIDTETIRIVSWLEQGFWR
jgi:hypothetical protein